MTIIYSILDNPEALARLRAHGLSEEQIREILSVAAQHQAASPADFTYVDKRSKDDNE